MAQGDEHGDFVQVFTLPETLTPGKYTVLVSGTSRVTVRAPLEIAGMPVTSEEEGGQRDESEPLLVPIQPAEPAVPVQPIEPAVPVQPAVPTASTNSAPMSPTIPIVIALAVVVVAITLWRVRARRV